jgi:hypothetical protein
MLCGTARRLSEPSATMPYHIIGGLELSVSSQRNVDNAGGDALRLIVRLEEWLPLTRGSYRPQRRRWRAVAL